MKVRIYNIAANAAEFAFRDLSSLMRLSGVSAPDSRWYYKVFDGEIPLRADNTQGNSYAYALEDLFTVLNVGKRPENFKGHSLSVSDVVEVVEPCAGTPTGFYFCDSIGWKQIPFDASLCQCEEQPEMEV